MIRWLRSETGWRIPTRGGGGRRETEILTTTKGNLLRKTRKGGNQEKLGPQAPNTRILRKAIRRSASILIGERASSANKARIKCTQPPYTRSIPPLCTTRGATTTGPRRSRHTTCSEAKETLGSVGREWPWRGGLRKDPLLSPDPITSALHYHDTAAAPERRAHRKSERRSYFFVFHRWA